MLKRIAGIIVALLAFAAPAVAQSPFVRVSATVTLAVTTTSGRVAIGTSARISTLWVCNTGSNDAYIYFGDSTVVALTDGTILRSGVCGNISPDGKTNLAAITAASTTTLVITPGSGVLFGTGGGGSGGGGAVTVADGANVVEGTTTDAPSCASGTSLLACQRQTDADIKGSITGGTARIGYTSDDPCTQLTKTNLAIATATGTTQLVAPSGSTQVYVCSFSLIAAATATVNLVGGTGATCTTGTPVAAIGSTTAANGMSLAANGGLTFGNGGATTVRTTTGGHGLCLIQSGTTALAGNITYVQQ